MEQAEFFGMGARLSGSSARMSATETPGPFLTPVAQGCAIAPLPSQPHVIFNSSDARAPRHPNRQWRAIHAPRLARIGSELLREASCQWAGLKQFFGPFVYLFFRNRLAVRLPHA